MTGILHLSTRIRQMADGLNDHLAIWIGSQLTSASEKVLYLVEVGRLNRSS